MKLVWKYGEEAVCPKCGHNNACLGNGSNVYTCRDCKTKFAVVGQFKTIGKDAILGRKIVEAECVMIPTLTQEI